MTRVLAAFTGFWPTVRGRGGRADTGHSQARVREREHWEWRPPSAVRVGSAAAREWGGLPTPSSSGARRQPGGAVRGGAAQWARNR